VSGFQITPRAARDLEFIADWTLKNWGSDRMESYLRNLNQRFIRLAQNPNSGRAREDLGKGYRCSPEGRHLVFYVIVPTGIAIIGVPHQAMDMGGFFSE
jgi:toxin ParE1/3/4